MRKIMFIGRSEAGKTTLSQAMKGDTITYHKTQYVNHYDAIIDTPGEYLQSKNLISALAVFTAEADVIGLLMDATEPFSLYSPGNSMEFHPEYAMYEDPTFLTDT